MGFFWYPPPPFKTKNESENLFRLIYVHCNVWQIQTLLQQVHIRIRLEFDLIPKNCIFLYFLFLLKFIQDFYSKIILYIYEYNIAVFHFYDKSLLSESLNMIFWIFGSMFCSLRIRIRNTGLNSTILLSSYFAQVNKWKLMANMQHLINS